MKPPPEWNKLTCERCCGEYQRTTAQLRVRPSRFCSRRCKYASRSTGSTVPCAGCRTEFYRKPSAQAASNYCSRDCYDRARATAATSYAKDGTRHTHRNVAEAVLGRRLRAGEVVHHIDGDKRNNAPDNLQVMTAV